MASQGQTAADCRRTQGIEGLDRGRRKVLIRVARGDREANGVKKLWEVEKPQPCIADHRVRGLEHHSHGGLA
ncbi:MAG: hypothetical protein WBO45_08290 [Planctomycetota bacterium]